MNIENIKKYSPQEGKIDIYDNIAVFEISASQLGEVAIDLRNNEKYQLKTIVATDERVEDGCFKIWYVFGSPQRHEFVIAFIRLKDTEKFPSLTPIMHEAWNYERRIQTFFGLVPVGHPDQRSIILHENWPADTYPLRRDYDIHSRPEEVKGKYEFQKIRGEGIYEIPVGPIHAGIIEPGHFRFSVAGEEIVLLEPRLGYTHKGSEKIFENLSPNEMVRLSEKISGDSSFSHSLAFCQALEKLGGLTVSKRAAYLRVIFAELERLANHFGDIGAIMIDTGFNFGGANGARLREMIMQTNERLTGSRFLRGVNVFGGVSKDIGDKEIKNISVDLKRILKDFSEVMGVADDSFSLLNRLKATGTLSRDIATDHGATGIAAKAVGIENDDRTDFPYAGYGELLLDKIETEQSGDVYARFLVRVKEVRASIKLIEQALRTLPEGSIKNENGGVFKKNAVALSVVEGWRGEILYFLRTDGTGKIIRVAPRDPSFINWALLEYAGAHNVVPDFPLINKSFNLSYTGNDL